jgi:hypothetical protein
MRRPGTVFFLPLIFVMYVIHAVAQTTSSPGGVIESTSEGFKYLDGRVEATSEPTEGSWEPEELVESMGIALPPGTSHHFSENNGRSKTVPTGYR